METLLSYMPQTKSQSDALPLLIVPNWYCCMLTSRYLESAVNIQLRSVTLIDPGESHTCLNKN